MRSLPGPRIRLNWKFAGFLLLAGAAGLAAAVYALLTVGARVNGVWVSAELAVGAALQGQGGWALTAATAAIALVMAIILVLLLGRGSRIEARAATSDYGAASALPSTFELHSPERALAEAGKGMLRFDG